MDEADELTDEPAGDELAPAGRAGGLFDLQSGSGESGPGSQAAAGDAESAVQEFGIAYHGGSVMTSAIKLYFIWYGSWDAGGKAILTDYASRVGGSPWWAVNSTYSNSYGMKVSTSVTLAGQTTDNYSKGASLSDSAIWSVVSGALSAGKLPKDNNGIYFVLASPDVTATSGFCSQYCGFHGYGPIAGSKGGAINVKYAFVGNPQTQCLSSCSAQTASSPNSTSGNNYAGVDAMVSLVAHEAAAVATDPFFNAWYDSAGYENADKCAWTYGATSTAANGSLYNVTLGSRQYLVQRNWANVNPQGKCTMSYP